MINLTINAPICIACSRAAGCLGVCPQDKKPIHLHADFNFCGLGKFPDGQTRPADWDSIEEAKPVTPPPILAGDVIEALAKKIGADKAAKWLSRIIGKPCGCAKRRIWLNQIDYKLRRFLGLQSP